MKTAGYGKGVTFRGMSYIHSKKEKTSCMNSSILSSETLVSEDPASLSNNIKPFK